jgi:tetratricopeptide (TPR) repeat protein
MTAARRPRQIATRSAAAGAAAAIVLATLLAYLPALRGPFAFFDDELYVSRNTVLQNIPLTESWRFFAARTNAWEYLPLRDLTYRIDYAIFGLNPAGYKAHNLLLYGIACAGVWWLAMGLLRLVRGREDSEDPWIAAAATALFAVHPAHVESVAWISGRKDLLSGAFAIWSLALFTRALLRGDEETREFGWSYLLFAFAILSKSTVVPVPIVAWLIALAHEAGGEGRLDAAAVRRAVLRVVPLAMLAGGSVVLQVWGSNTYGDERVFELGASVLGRVFFAVRILGALAGIAVAPWRPRLIYDVEAPGLNAAVTLAAGTFVAGLTVYAAWRSLRSHAPAWLGIAMAGVLMLPFLQIIPISTWSYASDRFVFLPTVGVAFAAAVVMRTLGPVPRRGVLALVIAAALAGTAVQAWKWRTPYILVRESATLAPGNAMAVMTVVHSVLVPEKQYAQAREAVRQVRSQLHQTYLIVWIDALEASERKDMAALRKLVPKLYVSEPVGEIDERIRTAELANEASLFDLSERAYRDVLRDFPAFNNAHYDLGLVLAKQGRQAEALEEMQRAVDAGVRKADVWNNLGLLARNLGQVDRATAAFRNALAADGKHWHAGYNLARLLWARGDGDGARRIMNESRERAIAAGASTAPIDELLQVMTSTEPPPAPMRSGGR